MGKFFGTDGVRGEANVFLTPALAMELGRAGAYVLKKEKDRPLFLVAKDTRISGEMLENALCAGILSLGGDIIKAGVIPTPGAAYLAKKYGADAAVMISASHNPFGDNGIKFFGSEGYKLSDADESAIEDILTGKSGINTSVKGADLGRIIIPAEDPAEAYIEFVKSTAISDLSGMRLVLDCACGAASSTAEAVFKGLGADVTVIHNRPNGVNINDKCGSTSPESLRRKVSEAGADAGLAFDGDADRLIAVDETGGIVDGDRIIGVCMKRMKETGRLRNNRAVVTVMSNFGFWRAAEDAGIYITETDVGDRHVLEAMLAEDAVIGGEQSGHIIFREFTTTGDGMIAAIQLLEACRASGRKLSELASEIPLYPQLTESVRVKDGGKEKVMNSERVLARVKSIKESLKGEGDVFIRPSGTEPVVRITAKAMDSRVVEDAVNEIKSAIESALL